jgi:hypothetical protein
MSTCQGSLRLELRVPVVKQTHEKAKRSLETFKHCCNPNFGRVKLPRFDVHLKSSNLLRWRVKDEQETKGTEPAVHGRV